MEPPVSTSLGFSSLDFSFNQWVSAVRSGDVTEQFADEGLSLKRLEVIDVFSGPDEDDGTPGSCHADGKQQKKKRVNTSEVTEAVTSSSAED